MKKIYMPSEDELYQMQKIVGGNNMHTYLLIKAAEALIVDRVNYPAKGILRNAYEYIKNDPEMVRIIGLLYPSEIEYSNVARGDIALCSKLLNGFEDKTIYGLDNLSRFTDEVNYDPFVVPRVVDILDSKLPDMPRYRFEYQESPLLESIFSCDERVIDSSSDRAFELAGIEPGFALKLPSEFIGKEGHFSLEKVMLQGMIKYFDRYGFSFTTGMRFDNRCDVLNSKDEKVKRLIKTIYHDKDNLYRK